MIEIAGIERKTEFSPNHEYNDYLIIHETARELKKLGAKVNIYKEEDLFDVEIKEDYIFSMVQSPNGSEKLLEIAKDKKFVINSPESVRNCYRYNLNRILKENNIPFPKSIIVYTNTKDFSFLESFKNEMWIKRGDAHAVQKEDVVFIDDKSKVQDALKEFHSRGLERCAIQNNIEGDTVKFYSVYGEDLFYWYASDSKYYTNFDEEKLKETANKSAKSLGLEVFGGDAIITKDSDIYIVDINDWPSFAPIRDKASKVIGNLIYQKAINYNNC
jgi:glutathione synthase/RimK-type ligase-like ATP-grasp enzyme